MRNAKTNRWLVLVSITLLALGSVVAVAQAQGSFTPAQITVSGTRNTVAHRVVQLQTTAPLTDVRFLALDIPQTAGDAVLPARAIQATLPVTRLATNSFLTIPLTIDLAGVPSGQYQGEAQVWHQEGVISLPVTVNVKDGWFGPLLVLLIGILLAVGVSYYRAKGKPRDELLVRVGVLQTGIRQDAALDGQFRARIEAALVDVETALRAEKWEPAQAALDQAEGVWNRWRKGRADWLAQLAYVTTLRQGIQDLHAPQSRYLQRIERELTAVTRRAPDMEKPENLRTELEKLADQINRYAKLRTAGDTIGQTINQLPVNERPSWQQRAADWQQQLDELEPGNETTWTALQTAMRAGQQELAQAIAAHQSQDETLESLPQAAVKGILGQQMLAALLPLPAATISLDDAQAAANADWRLRLFRWVSYGLVIILLAGAGFAELYIGKATFGANAWGDYLALLAWGFGAEVSRTAVVEMVRGWGLPGFS
ncbi:MAG: hypothetical protein KC441_11760 [Anaerolineales bacterium]|nr:hypothetical protein [Anaerolineales bacterium]MCB0010249.1 hypothetical protein [Anaerolineales bacterium]